MGGGRARPGWAGSLLGGREAAARPQLLPLLLVFLSCLGRGAAAEDARGQCGGKDPRQPLCQGLEDLSWGT